MKKQTNLQIVILAIGLAASITSRAQNGLMPVVVANFDNTNENTSVGVIQGSDGMLYGSAVGIQLLEGGEIIGNPYGVIFRTTLGGSLTVLDVFDGTSGVNGTNGALPGIPMQAPDGNFYGAAEGGVNGFGFIYKMDTNGLLTSLFSFGQTNGWDPGAYEDPYRSLIAGNDGALYGLTQHGGPNFTNVNYGDGTIFKITTNGDFTSLASFNGTNGFYPTSITQGSDGNFYGTTGQGGIDDTDGNGTVFRMTTDGQLTTLFRFNGANGDYPNSIMQASDGCLYGTTGDGGGSGYGTVFKITTNGDFTLLVSFYATNGIGPLGLIEVSNGVFYGTTGEGGQHTNGVAQIGSGTLFQVTSNGNLTVMFSFGLNSEKDGGPTIPFGPTGPLIKGLDGNYYGTSRNLPAGCVYSIRPIQAPIVQSVAQAGQINLSWSAWAGYSYDVMYETNLTGSNWNLLSTITAQTNGITSYSDPIGPDTQRFYGVVFQLP